VIVGGIVNVFSSL